MSKRSGGSANPFARNVQLSGSAGNPNQRQQQQPSNPPRGQPNNGGRNPFAQSPQQTFAQPQQNQQQFQQKGQQFQKGQQGGRSQPGSNPFANRTGDSGSMEMDGGMDLSGNQRQAMQMQQRGGPSYPPRGQSNSIFSAGHNQSNQRSHTNQQPQQQGSRNPFAQPSGGGNPMAPNASSAAGRNPFALPAQQHQQQAGPGLFQQAAPYQQLQQPLNPLGHPNTPNVFAAQNQQPQLSAGMPGNTFFQQQQQQPSTQPTSFFATGNRTGIMNNAPPPTATVNAATLGAVNVSAALAPTKVEDIDLGLGLGAPSLSASMAAGVSPNLTPSSTAGPSAPGGAPTGGTPDGDGLQQAIQVLVTQILSSNPAAPLAEPPAQEDPYSLMTAAAGKLELVAGRVPSVPPQRKASKHGSGAGGAQRVAGLGAQAGAGAGANPFFGGNAGVPAAGGGNSIFGKAQ